MDVIVLSAIKKLRKYLEGKLDLSDAELGKIMAELKLKLNKEDFDKFNSTFETWRKPWTATRAENLDFLDVPVSTRADQETLQRNIELAKNINANVGDVNSRNLSTVMGRLGSIVGYGEQKVYKDPGAYTFTVPSGVTKISVTIVSGGGNGGGGSVSSNPLNQTYSITAKRGDYGPSYYPTFLFSPGTPGGNGAMMEVDLAVRQGQEFSLVVGGAGGSSSFGDFACTGGGPGNPAQKSLTRTDDYDVSHNSGHGTSEGGKGGRALNPDRPEVKRFLHGAPGAGTRKTKIYYLPFYADARSSQMGRYKRVLAPQVTDIDLLASPYIEYQSLVGPAEASTEKDRRVFQEKEISSTSAKYTSDYPQAGEGGSGGGLGEMTISMSRGSYGDSGQDSVAYRVYLSISTKKVGASSTYGQPGIVIVNY